MSDLRKIKLRTSVFKSERFGDVPVAELPAAKMVELQDMGSDLETVFVLIAWCVLGDDGEPYLTVAEVKAWPWAQVVEIGAACQAINGLDDEKKTD